MLKQLNIALVSDTPGRNGYGAAIAQLIELIEQPGVTLFYAPTGSANMAVVALQRALAGKREITTIKSLKWLGENLPNQVGSRVTDKKIAQLQVEHPGSFLVLISNTRNVRAYAKNHRIQTEDCTFFARGAILNKFKKYK